MNENNSLLAGQEFQKLVELMERLRNECPWDKKQTIQTLQKYTVEELYELMDAINDEDYSEIKEELGDVLFHTLFYSKIASETNDFTITDVIVNVHEKLVRRHPHVFGDISVVDEKEVSKNWEQIKLVEGKKSILAGVPKSLPALTKAYRIQEKVKQVGFEWKSIDEVYNKLNEELAELEEAKQKGSQPDIEEEFGDVLFSMINYARFLNIDPEVALEKTNKKFIRRFKHIEKQASINQKKLIDYSLDELDRFWNDAKLKEK